jgi:hypothetical protein
MSKNIIKTDTIYRKNSLVKIHYYIALFFFIVYYYLTIDYLEESF